MNTSRLLAMLALCTAAFGCADTEDIAQGQDPIEPSAAQEEDGAALGQLLPPVTKEIEILGVDAFGSGCMPGTYTAEPGVDPDGRAFWEIRLRDYKLTADIDHDVYQAKECKVVVKVKAPNGVAYGVTQATFTGRTILAQGMTAEVHTAFGFHGQDPLAKVHPFKGPITLANAGWEFTDNITSPVMSTCGANADVEVTTRTTLTNTKEKQSGEVNFQRVAGGMSYRLYYRVLACITPPRTN